MPRAVLDEVAASRGHPTSWDDGYTKVVTDWARHYGVRGAIERHLKGEHKEKPLPWSTADRWLKFWKDTGRYYEQ